MGAELEGPSGTQANRMANRPRDGKGKYLEMDGQELLDAEAARLRTRGLTFRQIGLQMGCSTSTAEERVKRCRQADIARREAGAELVQQELDLLDKLIAETLRVLESFHYVVNEGRVISRREKDPATGKHALRPLEDQGPVLAAVKTLNELSKSRRLLLGLDAEKKVNVSGGVTYRFEGGSAEDL